MVKKNNIFQEPKKKQILTNRVHNPVNKQERQEWL